MAKVKITIELHKSELIYDVQNKTYLTGRSRANGDNYEQVANMQANDDDENLNQVLRSLGNAWGVLKQRLSEYISDSSTKADNILMSETENIELALWMPSNFDWHVKDSMSVTMHQYLVNYAIGDWFTITNKEDASPYIALANANMEQLREAVNKRLRPHKPTEYDYEQPVF